jgi:SSS family transporter
MDRPLILVIGIFYLLMCLAIGFWAMKKNKNTMDFFAANKGIGIWLMVFGTFSAVMSGFGFVGGPGTAYTHGFGAMWITVSLPMGYFICWLVIGRKFKAIANKRTILSVPDILFARFESPFLRVVGGLAVIVGVIGYLASQMTATGWIMVVMFGWDFTTGLIVGLAVVCAYSIAGGVMAGLYTDVVQGLAMITSAAAIFILILIQSGGMVNLWETLSGDGSTAYLSTTFGSLNPMWGVSYLLMGIMGCLAQPHVASRFFMMKDQKSLRTSCLYTAMGYALCSLLILTIGNFVRAKVIHGDLPSLASTDMASITYIIHYTPTVLAGLVLAGLLGAIMSTTDAFLSVGAAAVAHDIGMTLNKGKTIPHELLWARCATVALIVVAAVLSIQNITLVMLLGAFGWAFFTGVFAPVLLFGLNWKRCTRKGAEYGTLTGFIVAGGLQASNALGWAPITSGVVNGAVGFLCATIVLILVSLSTSEEDAQKEVPADLRSIIYS